jgi:molecular chaperone HscB
MIDYFELFDLKVSFNLDLDILKKRFYKLSREFHPDHFTMESIEKQAETLKMSGIINTAYKTLSDENSRMKYILERYGLINENQNDALPQDFLMQMMEINELAFEIQMSHDADQMYKLISTLDSIENKLKIQANTSIDDFENQQNIDKSLENLKYYFLKSKYLLRIRENLSTFARS